MQISLLGWLGPAYLAAVSVPLAIFDIKQRRLPNKLVLPGFLVVWPAQLGLSIYLGHFNRIGTAALCCLALLAIGIMVNRIGAIGMGDVKLLALMGQCFGWWGLWPVLLAVAFGIVVAALFVLGSLALKRLKAGSTIPLGPYLLAGCLAASLQIYFGEAVVTLPA